MTEERLRWVIAGFAFFVAVAYFVWLCTVYAKFMDTDRFVRAAITDFYTASGSGKEPCTDCTDEVDDAG
jgi:hypothetical protein